MTNIFMLNISRGVFRTSERDRVFLFFFCRMALYQLVMRLDQLEARTDGVEQQTEVLCGRCRLTLARSIMLRERDSVWLKKMN